MGRTTTVVTVAALTALTITVGYAAYFDYKRRNDATFRKRLRREQKRAFRTATKAAGSVGEPTKEELREALQKVKDEQLPDSAEAKERYFMQSVSVGEQLCAQGEASYLPAALSFYRALRVYPSPVELIIIYQKTVPEPVFKIVMEMTSLDLQNRIEGYYDHFPSKEMNVSVAQTVVDIGNGQTMKKNILIVNKNFKAGEEIYQESVPMVAALDPDLESRGSHCSQCLRQIDSAMSLHFPDDPLKTSYCSKACQSKARSEFHNILFGVDPTFPNDPSTTSTSKDAREARKMAQEKLVASFQSSGKVAPLLVARLVSRQAIDVTASLGTSANEVTVTTEEGASNEYTLFDHVERLRFLGLPTPSGEIKLLSEVLETAMPGLEQFISGEKYTILKGKMAYNAIGICFGDGRNDKPVSKDRPEDVEKTRTPCGTDRQTGCGLYHVSSYLSHSCRPSVHPSFSDGTSALHLIANHALNKGDELTMAYVDVSQGPDETVQEARLRRRKELARGWRFACTCARCTEEGLIGGSTTEEKTGDESRVEAVVNRYDEKKSIPS